MFVVSLLLLGASLGLALPASRSHYDDPHPTLYIPDHASIEPELQRRMDLPTQETNVDPNNKTAVCMQLNYFDETCWDTLNMTAWLQDWEATTPLCKNAPTLNDDQCCSPSGLNETWSACFLRLMTRHPGYNCDQITSSTCDLSIVTPGKNLSDVPQITYTLRAIFATNSMFSTWWKATNFAMSASSLEIDSMINYLDPVKKVNASLDLILALVMVGFSLVAASEFFTLTAETLIAGRAVIAQGKILGTEFSNAIKQAGIDIKQGNSAKSQAQADAGSVQGATMNPVNAPAEKLPGTPSVSTEKPANPNPKKDKDEILEEAGKREKKAATAVNGVLLASLVDAPFLARSLWPAYTADSRMMQIGELSSGLDQIVTEIKSRLSNANALMMSDFDTFINATQQGRYVSNILPTIANSTTDLTLALKTYLLTSTMSHNGWQGVLGPNSTDGLDTSNSSISKNFGCTIDPATGACVVSSKGGAMAQPNGWFAYGSNVTKQFVTFNRRNSDGSRDNDHPQAAEIVSTAISKGWTTPSMLFDAGYLCSMSQNLTQLISGATSQGSGASQSRNSTGAVSGTPYANYRRDILQTNGSAQNVGVWQDTFSLACANQLIFVSGCANKTDGSQLGWNGVKSTINGCSLFFN